jgi:hypothetical protein
MRFPMKIGSLCMALTLCGSMQAQTAAPIPTSNPIPSSFFGMTSDFPGSQACNVFQYPEQTITNVDTNFTASPVGVLGHPTDG